MRSLTVLYDARCGVCTHFQRQAFRRLQRLNVALLVGGERLQQVADRALVHTIVAAQLRGGRRRHQSAQRGQKTRGGAGVAEVERLDVVGVGERYGLE